MEKFKSFFGGSGILVVMFLIWVGWTMYNQHQTQQRIQRQWQLQQQTPKGGVVVDQNGTIRWQD